MVIKLMPMERVMTREDLALLFIPFSKQKSVRVGVIFLFLEYEEAECRENRKIWDLLTSDHLHLVEETERDSSLVKRVHSSVIKHKVYFLHHHSYLKFQPDGIDLLTQADIN